MQPPSLYVCALASLLASLACSGSSDHASPSNPSDAGTMGDGSAIGPMDGAGGSGGATRARTKCVFGSSRIGDCTL
jgi:hypothetical protein